MVEQEGWAVSRDELLRRFAALPDAFPPHQALRS